MYLLVVFCCCFGLFICGFVIVVAAVAYMPAHVCVYMYVSICSMCMCVYVYMLTLTFTDMHKCRREG